MKTSDRADEVLVSPVLERGAEFSGELVATEAAVSDWKSGLEKPAPPGRSKKITAEADPEPAAWDRRSPARATDEPLPVAVPKARNQPVVSLIASQRSRNLCSEEETVLELYHANLSMHQLTILVQQFWGKEVGLSAIAKRYGEVAREIEAWCGRPIKKTYPYVFLASIELKCSCGLEKKQASVLIAEGVDEKGDREVLGVAEATEEAGLSWYRFLRSLKARGLCGVRMFIGDRCAGLAERVELLFPGMHFQTSVAQFRNEVLARIPTGHLLEVQDKLGLIDESTDWPEARRFVARMLADLKRLKLVAAAEFYETHVEATLNYLAMPREHWRGLRSNSGQVKLLRSIRERTRMVGAFSDSVSAVYLVSARLRHIEATVWREKRYPWGRL